jgi:hypothetical protein
MLTPTSSRFTLPSVGRGGPLVKIVLAENPPVTAPNRHRKGSRLIANPICRLSTCFTDSRNEVLWHFDKNAYACANPAGMRWTSRSFRGFARVLAASRAVSGLDAIISANNGLALSPRPQTRKKSCAEWPLLNRRLPIAQGRGVCRRSWQGRKSQSNIIDLVTVHPQLQILIQRQRQEKKWRVCPDGSRSQHGNTRISGTESQTATVARRWNVSGLRRRGAFQVSQESEDSLPALQVAGLWLVLQPRPRDLGRP